MLKKAGFAVAFTTIAILSGVTTALATGISVTTGQENPNRPSVSIQTPGQAPTTSADVFAAPGAVENNLLLKASTKTLDAAIESGTGASVVCDGFNVIVTIGELP